MRGSQHQSSKPSFLDFSRQILVDFEESRVESFPGRKRGSREELLNPERAFQAALRPHEAHD